jgi:hypothetical protein
MPEMSVARGTKITRAVLRRERTRQRRATHSHSLSYVRSKQRLRSYNCGKIGSARAQQLRRLAMLAAMRRASSGGVAALLATHQPQELGFVNVAVFDEAGD